MSFNYGGAKTTNLFNKDFSQMSVVGITFDWLKRSNFFSIPFTKVTGKEWLQLGCGCPYPPKVPLSCLQSALHALILLLTLLLASDSWLWIQNRTDRPFPLLSVPTAVSRETFLGVHGSCKTRSITTSLGGNQTMQQGVHLLWISLSPNPPSPPFFFLNWPHGTIKGHFCLLLNFS